MVEPEIPESLVECLELYWELRSAGGLSYAEIQAYVVLTGEQLEPDTVKDLRMIDRIVNESVEEISRGQSNTDDRIENSRSPNV